MTDARHKLINKVLQVIQSYMDCDDYADTYALLDNLPDEVLTAYLPMDVALELEQEKLYEQE